MKSSSSKCLLPSSSGLTSRDLDSLTLGERRVNFPDSRPFPQLSFSATFSFCETLAILLTGIMFAATAVSSARASLPLSSFLRFMASSAFFFRDSSAFSISGSSAFASCSLNIAAALSMLILSRSWKVKDLSPSASDCFE